jgi:hypothetical protein
MYRAFILFVTSYAGLQQIRPHDWAYDMDLLMRFIDTYDGAARSLYFLPRFTICISRSLSAAWRRQYIPVWPRKERLAT